MSLVGWFKGTGPSGFGYTSTAEEVTDGLDLDGETILITGCNSGLGKEAARVLAMRGATVFGAARTREKAQRACESFDGDARPVVCELSDPDSVNGCVDAVAGNDVTLDAIICNAGIMALPEAEQVMGFEKQFFVNHIGHSILVFGLLEHLADDGRVVMLSSEAHRRTPEGGIAFDNLSGEKSYDPWKFYGQSKLANLLFANKLAEQFEQAPTSRVANAVHPGVIGTDLARHMNPFLKGLMSVAGPLFLKSIPQGAATETYAAVHPDAAEINGEYLSHSNVAEPSDHGKDDELRDKLWRETEQIVEDIA
jgi:WW domain-containing oxidoreductase